MMGTLVFKGLKEPLETQKLKELEKKNIQICISVFPETTKNPES